MSKFSYFKTARANFRVIESELSEYNNNLIWLENAKKEIYFSTPIQSEGRTGPGDPTMNKVCRLCDKEILVQEERVGAINSVLRKLEKENVDLVSLIKYKYFDKQSDQAIYKKLHMSEATYYRNRRNVIELIARELGWNVKDREKFK